MPNTQPSKPEFDWNNYAVAILDSIKSLKERAGNHGAQIDALMRGLAEIDTLREIAAIREEQYKALVEKVGKIEESRAACQQRHFGVEKSDAVNIGKMQVEIKNQMTSRTIFISAGLSILSILISLVANHFLKGK